MLLFVLPDRDHRRNERESRKRHHTSRAIQVSIPSRVSGIEHHRKCNTRRDSDKKTSGCRSTERRESIFKLLFLLLLSLSLSLSSSLLLLLLLFLAVVVAVVVAVAVEVELEIIVAVVYW